MKNIFTDKDQSEYFQWLKDTGKGKYELTDIFINDNGEIKTEKRMACIIKTTPEDWKQFCKITGRDYNDGWQMLVKIG